MPQKIWELSNKLKMIKRGGIVFKSSYYVEEGQKIPVFPLPVQHLKKFQ